MRTVELEMTREQVHRLRAILAVEIEDLKAVTFEEDDDTSKIFEEIIKTDTEIENALDKALRESI